MLTIETAKGHVYELTLDAVCELQEAKAGDVAERVYNRLAPHVPASDRGDVWFAVDDV